MNKACYLILLLVSLSLVIGSEENEDASKNEEDNVISEQSNVNSHEESSTKEEEDKAPHTEEIVRISNLKVVQDNVSGTKHSAFSEDQSTNRADEQTITDIKNEAEKRVHENEMKKMQEENTDSLNTNTVESKEPETSHYPKDVNTNTFESEDDQETIDNEAKDSFEHDKTTDKEHEASGDSPVGVPTDNDDDDTEIVDLTQNKFEELKRVSITETQDHQEPDHEDDKMTSEQQNQEAGNEKDIEKTSDPIVPVEKPILHQEQADTDTSVSNDASEEDINLEEKLQEFISPAVRKDKATLLYEEAILLLSNAHNDLYTIRRANKIFLAAADLNHTKSMEAIAYPLLFGDNIKRNETKSKEIFQYLADKGIPVGQQGLGFMYGTGVNINSSQAKALIYTTFGALGGNTLAEMMLGYRYNSGNGVVQSCESALTYYKKVAQKVSNIASTGSGGNAVQRIRLYDELEQTGTNTGQIDEDLLQYYQYLADKGDTQAQIGLGQLYFQGGRGVDINYEKAFFYFNLAAANDNPNGLAYVGKMYFQGHHVKKDTKKAFAYFLRAAENKNPVGQAGLGMAYLKGEGADKDYAKAMQYFSQSAEQGWVEGQLQLGNMYYNGLGVKKDYRQAVKYFTFASQSGHVLAYYNLAVMHATGAGVMRSCRTATELFKNVAERGQWSTKLMDAYDAFKNGDVKTALLKYYLLAELGYEVAQSNVAYILDKDEATFYDQNQTYARALLQWSRAADQGYAVARVKLGDYYYFGLGTKVNYETAALHYRLASDQQSNAQAMFNLGFMHEQGLGLKKDMHLAKRFYDMAAEASPDAQFPVYLAVAKLAIDFSIEWLRKNYRFWDHIHLERIQLYVLQNAGPDWDLYLISVLAGFLAILLLFRRGLRN